MTDSDGLPAGDDVRKNFTKDKGSVGNFGVNAALSSEYESGYKVITVNLSGFDPGRIVELLAIEEGAGYLLPDGAASNAPISLLLATFAIAWFAAHFIGWSAQ